jgi:hypothetical protein
MVVRQWGEKLMATTDIKAKEKAREMRQSGHAIVEIVEETGVDRNVIRKWVRDIELTDAHKAALIERNPKWINAYEGGQANRRKGLIAREAAQQEGRDRAKLGEPLHRKGCILYWAEGAKHKSSVHLINTDPDMLIFFLRFLRESLNVLDEWVSIYIHCNTEDVQEHERMKRYWLYTLHLPPSCFRKVILKPKSKHQHTAQDNGICTIQVHKTDLVMHIFGAIQEYTGIDNPAWLF